MATCWKIYTPAGQPANGTKENSSSLKWEDAEVAELEKLSRSATETARKSIQQINAAKAEAEAQEQLDEMLKEEGYAPSDENIQES